MATIEKGVIYEAPGRLGSPVEVKDRYDNFIGGAWVPPSGGEYRENLSPATGEPFCEIASSTPADIELALDAAHAAKGRLGQDVRHRRAPPCWTPSPTRSRPTSRCSPSPRAGRTASPCARRSTRTSRSPSTTSATSPA